MYHFEISKHKKREEFILALVANKTKEQVFKVEGFSQKGNAKKMANKILSLSTTTEIADLTIAPKVDNKKAPAKKKASTKKRSTTKKNVMEVKTE